MAKSVVVQGPNGSDTLEDVTVDTLSMALVNAGVMENTVTIKIGNHNFTLSGVTGNQYVEFLREGRNFTNPFTRRRGNPDEVFYNDIVARVYNILTTRLKLITV